ncbi:MAG: His/Gly/Thr/Pro-type tRNA ligase C-terminal domain-containing protein, partial [Novosphingobium sp.]
QPQMINCDGDEHRRMRKVYEPAFRAQAMSRMIPLIERTIYTTDRFYDVEAISKDRAIVVGYGGKIIETTNGGRTWQVGTIQSDRMLPERLDASYIGEDGERHRPVMLHRAIFGSYERFIGILIEHFAGKLPVWLAPVQAVVATIVSDADGYAAEVAAKLKAAGVRVETDLRNEKINYKVREHSLKKVPHLLVVGKREAEEGTVAVRTLGEQQQQVMSLDEAITLLKSEATAPDLK